MRNAETILMDFRLKKFGNDEALRSAISELELQTQAEGTSMESIGLALMRGEDVDQFWIGRFEAWIDEKIHRTYQRLPESDGAVRRVAERQPYPWERKR